MGTIGDMGQQQMSVQPPTALGAPVLSQPCETSRHLVQQQQPVAQPQVTQQDMATQQMLQQMSTNQMLMQQQLANSAMQQQQQKKEEPNTLVQMQMLSNMQQQQHANAMNERAMTQENKAAAAAAASSAPSNNNNNNINVVNVNGEKGTTTCPHCGKAGFPRVQKGTSQTAWIWCFVLALFCPPFCFLAFYMCNDDAPIKHICKSCNREM